MNTAEKTVIRLAQRHGAMRSNRSPNEMYGAVRAFRRFKVMVYLAGLKKLDDTERRDPENWKFGVSGIVVDWNRLLTVYPDLQKFARSLLIFGLMNRRAAARDYQGIVSWVEQIISGLETMEDYLLKMAGR